MWLNKIYSIYANNQITIWVYTCNIEKYIMGAAKSAHIRRRRTKRIIGRQVGAKYWTRARMSKTIALTKFAWIYTFYFSLFFSSSDDCDTNQLPIVARNIFFRASGREQKKKKDTNSSVLYTFIYSLWW